MTISAFFAKLQRHLFGSGLDPLARRACVAGSAATFASPATRSSGSRRCAAWAEWGARRGYFEVTTWAGWPTCARSARPAA